MSFSTLSLHPRILSALKKAGYSDPTKIQAEAIPTILEGSDLRASAQTGSGKTAAFLLPALHRLANAQQRARGPRVLILTPTRELAMQVEEQARKYSSELRQIKTACVVGGVPYHVQLRKLSKPYDILIATPGRLIDLLDRKRVNLGEVELLVLDEADRMLDMGFMEPVEQIVAATPPTRQTVLFSATLRGPVMKMSNRMLTDPEEIVAHDVRARHDNISQRLHYADDIRHKNRLLDHVLRGDDVDAAVVFTATKRHADQLVVELEEKGYRAAALHGDMHQRQRTRTIKRLRDGKVNVLVATDVAARGIDVPTITHVVNFDLPRNVEDYVHRIGRTGRAGAQGTAVSFAGFREGSLVKQIEKFTGQPIEASVIEGLEPRQKAKPPLSRRPKSRYPKGQGGFRGASKGKPSNQRFQRRRAPGKRPARSAY